MKRLLVSCLFALAAAAPLQPLAAPRPPPGWGKPKPLPPANGTGKLTVKHGDANLSLPLQKIEIDKTKSGLMVSLQFVDAAQQDRASLAFFVVSAGAQKVPDMQITGILVKSKAGGTSRGVANKTKCNLTLSTLTEKAVAGTASCEPLFEMDGTTAARPASAITFDATMK